MMIYLIFFVLFFSFSLNSVYATSIMDSMNVLLNTDYNWVSSVQTIIFITSLTFIPIFFLMMTSFTRIIIVFGLLRNAFGTPYSPPNQILLGMALFLTFFIMSPVFNKIYNEAYVPFIENKINLNRAIEKGSKPIHAFMLKQTREKDLNFFINISNSKIFGKDNIPINILIPAFIISELNTAFQIGFSIFMPFLIIDLIVASVLMALGMMMVPPALLSLPFKLILFVLADGWQLLINSLIHSF